MGCISNHAASRLTGPRKESRIPSAQLRWLIRHFRYHLVVTRSAKVLCRRIPAWFPIRWQSLWDNNVMMRSNVYTIAGYVFVCSKPADVSILFLHGNAQDISRSFTMCNNRNNGPDPCWRVAQSRYMTQQSQSLESTNRRNQFNHIWRA